MTGANVVPFHLEIGEDELTRLRSRLESVRWPDPQTVDDSSQGVPLSAMRELCDYWRRGYDWRRCEARINAFGLYRTEIDGLEVAFLHVRSPHDNALPVLLTHGWPGSIWEFSRVIAPLSDPTRYGGEAGDAFHVVVPCLPGFGFSGKPRHTGWGFRRIADAWIALMERLGYDRWVAQGGDLGSGVTEAIGRRQPSGCVALHLNMSFFQPTPEEIASADEVERGYLARTKQYFDDMAGYAIQQGTRPQTIGYSLADSAVGQAAWMYEKFLEASDPRSALGADDVLDNVMLYWLPNAGASAARLYWELRREGPAETGPIELPTGYSSFPFEVIRASRRWMEARFTRLIHFGEPARGGHFAALEQPRLFVEELCRTFRNVR